jgi:hypothetical protein
LVSSTQFLPFTLIAFFTIAWAKLVPLPSHTNFVRWQLTPASVGELELVLRKMQPYFCATCEIALATPECSAPMRNEHSLRVIMRSATREPVAGVVSVSMCSASTVRPRTPPFSLNSLIAIIAPRRSSPPEAPYWPLASMVRPMVSGFFAADCAHAWWTLHGPKKEVAAPAATACIRLRRFCETGLVSSFMVCSS